MAYLDTNQPPQALTINSLLQMRQAGEKITCLTAYDASFAALFDAQGIDAILVGDSLGNVIQGHQTTIPVQVEEMVYHTMCVRRGLKRAYLISDLPFASYANPDDALYNAKELMQAGANMVKLEGGQWFGPIIEHLVRQGIPVCAHIGLTPQSVNTLGGFKVQGKSQEHAQQMIADAIELEAAGAQLLVLEAIPASLGKAITEAISIPTIGIGAGPDCSGQVLVMHDALGAFPGRKPKFVKNFLAENPSIDAAIAAFIKEVKSGAFPAPEHCFSN
jgi:3-methyl-2-oxobutanoate hydroxymethyltransferase